MKDRLGWLRQQLGEVLGGPIDDEMFAQLVDVVDEYADGRIEDREVFIERETGLRGGYS